MNYSNLVSKLLNNQHLHAAIDKLVDENASDGNCLNLVNHEWSSILENDIMYQNFLSQCGKLWKKPSSTVNYEFEELKGPHFQCIIAGFCKLKTPFNSDKQSVIVLNSEPLAKIAKAMLTDLTPISNEHKFNFINCGISSCGDCKEFAASFQKMGYKINRLFQPCIADTKIYDGKGVVNRFYCQFESLFQKEFIAILHLDIYIRYSFTDSKTKQKSYRISGDVFNFIGFQENKLTLNKKIDVGPLVKLQVEKPPKNEESSYEKNEKSPYEELDSFMAKQDTADNLSKRKGDDCIGMIKELDSFMAKQDTADKLSKRKGDDCIGMIKKAKLTEDVDEFIDLLPSLIQDDAINEKLADNLEDCTESCEIDQVLLI